MSFPDGAASVPRESEPVCLVLGTLSPAVFHAASSTNPSRSTSLYPTPGFTGISDLTKMYSGIWHCVVIRRGTFTPHRVPGFEDCVWQTGAVITGQTQRRLCCRLRFQRVTLHCQVPGSRQRKSHRVGTPDLSQRLSSKSMAISETPAQGDGKSLVFRHICEQARG